MLPWGPAAVSQVRALSRALYVNATKADVPEDATANPGGLIFRSTGGAAAIALDSGSPGVEGDVPGAPTAGPTPKAGATPTAASFEGGSFTVGGQGAAGGGPAGDGASRTAQAEPEPEPLTAEQREVLGAIVREALASEDAVKQLLRVQRAVLGRGRPDLAASAAAHAAAQDTLRRVGPQLRVRPSLLEPLWGATGAAIGAVAALSPRPLADAIRGGAAEALAEAHTGHLRRLARAGVPAGHPTAEALRDVLRQLRDADTPPASAPRIPDLVTVAMNQQLPENLKPSEVAGGATKLTLQGLALLSSYL